MINPVVNSEKLPPHNVDAEEAVIGALLIDPEAVFEVSTFLKPEDFYREKNCWAYESCLALYDRNEAIDQITVANEIAQKGRIEALGGAAYLSHLVSLVPTSVDVKYYAQIVHRSALARRLIAAGAQISALGYDAGADVDRALNRAEDILFGLRHTQSARDFVHIKDVLGKYLQDISPSPKEEGHIGSIVSGFRAVDDILGGGLQRSDMVVLAARPSMG
ncbi:MAG: DnaB-like helicase N-terminal domain-containing protein, partial [Dehalococcoidia bacterium]|nr:DnaB-like helicase N-terminal domain-containing protein [Dehalococcoidia bacterium]